MRGMILTLAATSMLLLGGLTWTDSAEARPRRYVGYRAPVVRYTYRPYAYGYRPYYGYRNYYYGPRYAPYGYPRYYYGRPYSGVYLRF